MAGRDRPAGLSMREFWDERAGEDAFYFVDNKQHYRHPDAEAFWERGEYELGELFDSVGAKVKPTDDVVEIGCGVGRMTRLLAQRSRTVRALDISPRMLELARRHCEELANVEFLLGDGVSVRGVADASVDACVSHVVFQHIPDPDVTLGYVRDIGRVLRPGGWAAFQVSNDRSIHRRRTGCEGLAIWLRAKLGRGPKGQADPSWLGSAIDLEDLRRAAQDGGMAVERVSGEGRQMCYVLTRRL
jgi:SAM-dependent methyltransferase